MRISSPTIWAYMLLACNDFIMNWHKTYPFKKMQSKKGSWEKNNHRKPLRLYFLKNLNGNLKKSESKLVQMIQWLHSGKIQFGVMLVQFLTQHKVNKGGHTHMCAVLSPVRMILMCFALSIVLFRREPGLTLIS